MTKKKRKVKTNWIIISIFIVLFVLLFFCILNIYNTLKTKERTVKTLDTIEPYGYHLNENDPKYFKDLFKELKEVLETKEVDEESYVSLVSQLFITDFYSLNHATSKNDVGGIQFVYKDYQESFRKLAKDTVYAYVESNLYGKRNQELPNVKKVSIESIEQKVYEGEKETDDEAYLVELSIEYEKDLEYPMNCTLILIHSNDRLEIAKMDSSQDI